MHFPCATVMFVLDTTLGNDAKPYMPTSPFAVVSKGKLLIPHPETRLN